MKAAVLDKYDKQGRDLTVVEVPMPEMKADEVLVRVHTAGVNPLDNMIVRGEVKLIVPYTMPLIMGNEFCGTIEKMGEEAHGFSVGDRVYGRLPLNHIGAFAEYVAVSSDAVAKVPDYLSDEEATAVPLTALTALQALELLQVKSGDSVFISGGTGSFGAMAIPIAKSRGLKVITNGSASQRDRVISLGADRLIDYRAEDYSKTLHDIDGIIDTLGERELPKEPLLLLLLERLPEPKPVLLREPLKRPLSVVVRLIVERDELPKVPLLERLPKEPVLRLRPKPLPKADVPVTWRLAWKRW